MEEEEWKMRSEERQRMNDFKLLGERASCITS